MRACSIAVAAVALLIGVAARAETVSAPSRQAVYDAAQAAYDAEDWTAAARGFAPLLPDDRDKALSTSEGVIASRYASALRHLGRLDEAESWIERALPTLPATNPAELTLLWITKGDVLRFKFDYPGALAAYHQADGLAQSQGAKALVIQARLGEAMAGATVDPAFVRTQLEAIRSDPEFKAHGVSDVRAQVDILDARAALMVGDRAAARHLARLAIDESGGLTETASVFQVSVRADAATIATLRRDDDDARLYLAYTGAGHLANAAWIRDHSGDLPVCDDRVHPEDIAVVAFAIDADGRVSGAVPTYASRPGQVGQIFAEAASHWTWDPEAIKAVSPFWRATVQLGLRCVTRPNPERLGAFAAGEVKAWLVAHGVASEQGGVNPSAPPLGRVRSDDPRLSRPGGAVLGVIYAAPPKTTAEFTALWTALEADHAPPAAFALAVARWAQSRSAWSADPKVHARPRAEAFDQWVPRFSAKFPGDRSVTWLLLEQALAHQDAGQFTAAQPLLDTVIRSGAADRPSDADPLISIARLHQAIGFDRIGQPGEAAAALARSGLTADQCALFDTHPVPERQSIGSSAYPQTAIRWRFEGFVQTAFDIADDGRVKNVRAVIAYPPFVFDEGTEQAVLGFRYIPPRLGGRAMGCESQRVGVVYRMAP